MRRRIVMSNGMSPEEMTHAILNAPSEHTVTVIRQLLDERISLCSRDERDETDQNATTLWMRDLVMRVEIHRLAQGRVRVSPKASRVYNIAQAEGARAALLAAITELMTER